VFGISSLPQIEYIYELAEIKWNNFILQRRRSFIARYLSSNKMLAKIAEENDGE
jgi:hypothetical protein